MNLRKANCCKKAEIILKRLAEFNYFNIEIICSEKEFGKKSSTKNIAIAINVDGKAQRIKIIEKPEQKIKTKEKPSINYQSILDQAPLAVFLLEIEKGKNQVVVYKVSNFEEREDHYKKEKCNDKNFKKLVAWV
ncbi:MAG: hypothetical protein N4A44_03975 [Alphaproteobacteria bacterium]|jgi:hypothetical protein|nr:hypothetical protein [Alphaproteobacteria bacterium]